MKFPKFIILFFLLVPISALAQNWEWGLKATGNNQMRGDEDIAVDHDGNAVIAGHFQQSLILDGQILVSNDNYYSDVFLGKINPSGRVLWLKCLDVGRSYDDYIGLTLDDDGNSYLTGAKDGYVFVSKYDSTGALLWMNDFDRKYYGYGREIAVDQFDNVYVVGGSGSNFFAAKLNYYGKTVWAINRMVGYSNGYNINDLDVDSNGSIYFVGTSDGLDSIKLDDIVLKQKGSTFWGKISPNGKFLWARTALGRTNEFPQIALTSDDKVFISGSFTSDLTIENTKLSRPFYADIVPFITKYDTEGNFIWAEKGNTNIDAEGFTSDIKVDYDGNLYLTGGFFTTYGSTEYDYYLEKYNSVGGVIWRKEFKNGGSDYSQSIDLDAKGNVYNIGKTAVENFIDVESNSSISTFGIGKLNTNATTRKRPKRPVIDRVYFNFPDNGLSTLLAQGQNIKWYDHPQSKNPIQSSSIYEKEFSATDTLYVTQTIDGMESWLKEVIVYKTDLSTETIKYNQDTLSVSPNDYFSFQWLCNETPIPNSNTHYCIPDKNGVYSVVIHAGTTKHKLSFDFERPEKPLVDSLRAVCYKDSVGVLNAFGNQIIWYASKSYQDTLYVGNAFKPITKKSVSYFVRQTIGGIASYPQQVFVIFSELNDSVLQRAPDRLSTTYREYYKYQWYLGDSLIEGAVYSVFKPKSDGLYSVFVTDGICSRTLSAYFVTQPVVPATTYYVCRGDSMPMLHAMGDNLIWLCLNSTTRRYDTIYVGNSFIPNRTVLNNTILLIRKTKISQSYPLFIRVLEADFSALKVSGTAHNLSVSGKNASDYNYQWYYDMDTLPISKYASAYVNYFGTYRVKVTFGNKCDTTFQYSHYLKIDTIIFLSNAENPEMMAGEYSDGTKWYSDEKLTNISSSFLYFRPMLYGKDSTFYLAQTRNGVVIWRQKIQFVYPNLNSLILSYSKGLLRVNNPKSYHQYLWQLGDSTLKTTTSYCLPEQDGTYSVTVSAGASSNRLYYTYLQTSIPKVTENSQFRVTPNPVKNFLTIESNVNPNKKFRISIYSILGEKMVELYSDSKKTTLDLSRYKEGVYMVKLEEGALQHVFKVNKTD